MAEEGKKISFGFAKSLKKPILKTTLVPQQPKKIDYIECLDEKNIKVIGEEEKKEEPLVIPLLGSKTWHDRIVNKIDADIFEPKVIKEEIEDVKQEGKPELTNGNTLPKDNLIIKQEPGEDSETKTATLEEQAAKEIIEDLKSNEKQQTETNSLTLPVVEDQSLRGTEQSSLEDYEKIPVDAFGVAMLRGMGWQPGKGIGKNEKIVSAVIPELRPKGMGLGADKLTLQKKSTDSKKQEEELKIEKGTFVKIIAGKQSNNYGQIEGFDDDAGRLIIKLALGGNIISVNEFMVQPVTKSEYSKNAKVLNAKKYEEYKDKETKEIKHKTVKKRPSTSPEQSESSEDDNKSTADEKKKKGIRHKRDKHSKVDEKKSKSRKRHSDSESNDDSTSDHGKKRRKERSRSGSSDSYELKKAKKSKKSKKHKKRDNSSERSSKKHKKKDKEREKTRDRKSRDSMDKRKHKKRRRSKSRSSSRR